jgi:hypothetical protein
VGGTGKVQGPCEVCWVLGFGRIRSSAGRSGTSLEDLKVF